MTFRAAVSKFKMIRTASLFKDVVTPKSHNKFMSYFKSKLAFQVSVVFSGLAVVGSMLTTKAVLCSPDLLRWLGMIIYWMSNVYFIFEWSSLVAFLHQGIHRFAQEEAVSKAVRGSGESDA